MGRVNITMPDELWAAVGEAAEEAYGGNRSLFVRKALKAHLMNAGLRQARARALAKGAGEPDAALIPTPSRAPEPTHREPADSGWASEEHLATFKTEVSERPTAQQLAGRNKVPVATAQRWLDSDEWRRYWP